MTVASQTVISQTVMSHTAETPCAFRGCRGVFHPGIADTGVVLCSSWGLEELATRTAWRNLAESLSAAGYPSLRFDYPGTGNSLGTAADVLQWTQAVQAAAGFLQAYSGAKRLVLAGHSLGAAIAMTALPGLPDIESLILIAPVASGAAYVRALQSLAGTSMNADGLSLAGFSLPADMISSLKALEPLRGEPLRGEPMREDTARPVRTIVFERSGRKAGAQVSEHFKRLGSASSLELIAPFVPGAPLQPLPVAIETIVEAVTKSHRPGRTLAAPRLPLMPATLRAATFREEPLALAPGPQAIFCHPAQSRPGTPIFVFLGDLFPAPVPVVGLTRALAGHGLTSLQLTAREPNPTAMIQALHLALDALAPRGTIVLVAAGEAAAAVLEGARINQGARITDVIAIDPLGIGAGAEASSPLTAASLAALAIGTRAATPSPPRPGDEKILFFQDLAKIAEAAREPGWAAKAKAAATRLFQNLPCPVWLRAILLRDPRPAAAKALFAALARRGTAVSLLYSDAPSPLADLARHSSGGRLARNGVAIFSLPGGDEPACVWLIQHLAGIAGPEAAPRDGRQAAA